MYRIPDIITAIKVEIKGLAEAAAATQTTLGPHDGAGPSENSGSANVNVTTTTTIYQQTVQSTSREISGVATYQPKYFYSAVHEEQVAAKRLKVADTTDIDAR